MKKIKFLVPEDEWVEDGHNEIIKLCRKYKYVKCYHYDGEYSYPDHFDVIFYSNEKFTENQAIESFENEQKDMGKTIE